MIKQCTTQVFITAVTHGEVRVLLHFHKKHQIWLGMGGHVEPGENPVEGALREVREETGLTDVKLVSLAKQNLIKTKYVMQLTQPFMILEEKISATPKEAAHIHIDFIYLATTKFPLKVIMVEMHGWFSEKELENIPLTREVLNIAKEALTHTHSLL
jgi:8-oxo-dGTP pyrophosphatase MutT (NUDIX family)